MSNNKSNHIDDQILIEELQRQFHPISSPVYDEQLSKISDQYSQVSESMESVIRVKSDEDNSESEKSKSEEKRTRWNYCCNKCTKSDKGSSKPKTCVCIVPASQRRILIGEQGCLTCKCTGCSIEDKKKKRKIKRKKSSSDSSSQESSDFKVVNGCCKKCMKAFSKKGKEAKSCLCQVPRAVRKKPLPAHGCQYCGCHGCNPEDKKKDKLRKNSGPLSPMSEDLNEQNLQNFQNAPLISWLNDQNLNAGLLGIGIPQRTYSYIYGGQK